MGRTPYLAGYIRLIPIGRSRNGLVSSFQLAIRIKHWEVPLIDNTLYVPLRHTSTTDYSTGAIREQDSWATLYLPDGGNQPGKQGGAGRDTIEGQVFIGAVVAPANGAKTIERRNSIARCITGI